LLEFEGSDHGASEPGPDVEDTALQAKLKQIEDTCDEYEKALLVNVILPSEHQFPSQIQFLINLQHNNNNF